MLKTILLAGALAAFSTSASAAELITNGSFENPAVGSPCCNTVPPDNLPGWVIDAGNVNVVNGTFSSSAGNLAADGSQYLDLVGQGGVGSISQTFNTIANKRYNIHFLFSHNLFSGPLTASASVSVGSLADIITHSTGSSSNLDWRPYSGSFLATGPSSTLNFTNLTGGQNEGIFLDAVSVSAVPEPSTWAMLLIGFFAVAGGLRSTRRRSKRAVLYA